MRKIPTLFVRDFDHHNGRYVTQYLTSGCEWVLAGEGVATRKYDGTCIRVTYNDFWARREVKVGKSAPPGFVEIERDEQTGKRVGWEPWSSSSFAKFISEAIQTWADEHQLPDVPPGMYELVGPKINGNPERQDRHRLISHAQAERINLPDDLGYHIIRGTVLDLAEQRGYEGIVWHHPDGHMAKIKARDFPKDCR